MVHSKAINTRIIIAKKFTTEGGNVPTSNHCYVPNYISPLIDVFNALLQSHKTVQITGVMSCCPPLLSPLRPAITCTLCFIYLTNETQNKLTLHERVDYCKASLPIGSEWRKAASASKNLNVPDSYNHLCVVHWNTLIFQNNLNQLVTTLSLLGQISR